MGENAWIHLRNTTRDKHFFTPPRYSLWLWLPWLMRDLLFLAEGLLLTPSRSQMIVFAAWGPDPASPDPVTGTVEPVHQEFDKSASRTLPLWHFSRKRCVFSSCDHRSELFIQTEGVLWRFPANKVHSVTQHIALCVYPWVAANILKAFPSSQNYKADLSSLICCSCLQLAISWAPNCVSSLCDASCLQCFRHR